MYLLKASRTVSGSHRSPLPKRHHPLKSIVQTSLGATGWTGPSTSVAWRRTRRLLGSTKPPALSTRWQLETPIRCCSALKYNSLIFFGPQWGYAILNRTSRHTTVSLSCVGELNGRRLRSAHRLIPPNRARSRHSRPVLRVTSYSRHNAVNWH